MTALGDLQSPVPGSASAPLITLDQYKALLGITTDADGAMVDFSLKVASGVIQQYVGRSLVFQEYSEIFDCPGQRVGLREFPVREIKSVTDDMENYRLNKGQGVMFFDRPFLPRFQLEITYEAGYETMPVDLVSVLLELGKRQLLAMGVETSATDTLGSPTKSVTVGALRVDYMTAAALTENVGSPVLSAVVKQYADVLDFYRHPRILAATP
jgi:hypothetical protein